MTTIVQTDFIADLVAITEVGMIVHPVVIPSGSSFPAISYQFRDGDREPFYVGSFGLASYTVQLDIYSHNYLMNQTIYDAIIAKYNGFTGLLNSNTQVQRISVNSTLNAVDGEDSSLFRTIVELQILT